MTATGALAPADRIEGTARVVALALAAGSLAWRSAPVTAGVVLGSLIALASHRALVRFVRALVAEGATGVPRGRLVLHLAKYGIIAAVIAAALRYKVANPIALLVGASVLLPAIARESLAPGGAANAKEA